MSAGRPLVIDYYTSDLRGVAMGDLVIWFGEPALEPCYVELEPIDGVAILAERHLVGLLEDATLREAGPPWHRHPAISLADQKRGSTFSTDIHLGGGEVVGPHPGLFQRGRRAAFAGGRPPVLVTALVADERRWTAGFVVEPPA